MIKAKIINLTVNIKIFLEPVQLIGEGEYNLNILNEIKITESYMGLDQNFRKCQNKESFDSCTTKEYHDSVLDHCGCLPFNIRLSNKVISASFILFSFTNMFRNLCALSKSLNV